MIKAAIFDADGTLLDSMWIWDNAGAAYLKKFNIVPEPYVYERMATMTVDIGAAFLKELYGLDDTTEEIKQAIIQNVWDAYRVDVQLKPGVITFLEELRKKNIRIVAATAGERSLLEFALTRLNAIKYFDRIFICGEHGTSKYEPLIYHTAAEYMGAEPHETLVFEDALYAVTTAASAGFKTIAVADASAAMSWEKIKKLADYHIDDFNDFEAFWKAASAF